MMAAAVISSKIYTKDPRTSTHLYHDIIRTPIEGLQGFPVNKITTVYQVRISLHLLQSEYKDKTHVKHRMVLEECGHISLCLFCMVSNLSPFADDAITQGGVWGQESLVYMCQSFTQCSKKG